MTRTVTSLAQRLTAGALLATVLLGTLATSLTLIGAAPAQAVPAYAEGDEGNLSVEIVDPNAPKPTPTPTVPPGQGGTVPGPPAAVPPPAPPRPQTPAPSSAQQSITDPATADAALGDGAESMAGLIYVSRAMPAPGSTLHPNGGDVSIVVSIRNLSSETIDGTVRFWLTTAWGWMASDVFEVLVTGLAPGETRQLTATLPGPGQWAFYETHAEFVPPAMVDGVELQPITRSEHVLVFPWFGVSTATVALAGIGGYVWWARQRAARAVIRL